VLIFHRGFVGVTDRALAFNGVAGEADRPGGDGIPVLPAETGGSDWRSRDVLLLTYMRRKQKIPQRELHTSFHIKVNTHLVGERFGLPADTGDLGLDGEFLSEEVQALCLLIPCAPPAPTEKRRSYIYMYPAAHTNNRHCCTMEGDETELNSPRPQRTNPEVIIGAEH